MTNDQGVELLKVSCLLTRRPDLTHEQFFRYWTEQHTPMLAQPQPGAPKVVVDAGSAR